MIASQFKRDGVLEADDHIEIVIDQGQVLYRPEKRACRRFPGPGSQDLFGGVSRNLEWTPTTAIW